MSDLRIQTLGTFRAWLKGQLISNEAWPTHKSQLLFKLLLTDRGHFVPAERLMDILWPDLPVLAENAHPFENLLLRADNTFGLLSLSRQNSVWMPVFGQDNTAGPSFAIFECDILVFASSRPDKVGYMACVRGPWEIRSSVL